VNRRNTDTNIKEELKNLPILHTISTLYVTGIRVVVNPKIGHTILPSKSTTAKRGMKYCPSLIVFILNPYTKMTVPFPKTPITMNNTRNTSSGIYKPTR
jgi:hypothetical protein